MPASLTVLERQRTAVLARILDLGDFRSGSVSAIRVAAANRLAAAISPLSPTMARTFA